MNIIRDEEMSGLLMIPLLVDWNIKRCNFRGCIKQPNTIIAGIENLSIFGLCEEHFQMANVEGGAELSLEWNDFDAFKKLEEK